MKTSFKVFVVNSLLLFTLSQPNVWATDSPNPIDDANSWVAGYDINGYSCWNLQVPNIAVELQILSNKVWLTKSKAIPTKNSSLCHDQKYPYAVIYHWTINQKDLPQNSIDSSIIWKVRQYIAKGKNNSAYTSASFSKEVITNFQGTSVNPTPKTPSGQTKNSKNTSQAQTLYAQIADLAQSLSAISQKSNIDISSASNSVSKIKGYISSLNFSAELLNNKLTQAQSTLNYQINFANSHPSGFSTFTLNSNIQSAQYALAHVQAAVQKFNQDIWQLQSALNQCSTYYQQVMSYTNDVASSVQSINNLQQLAQNSASQGLVSDVQTYLIQSQQLVSKAQQSEATALSISGEADQLAYSTQTYYQDAQTQQQLG